jgi:hypothetical protein
MVKRTFKKFKRSRQANAPFFFKILRGKIFFYWYESKKPSGDQIREMVATGFGRFHMESPKEEIIK